MTTTTAVLTAGTWYHIVANFFTQTIYINNVLQSVTVSGAVGTIYISGLYLGSYAPPTAKYYFDGDISLCRMYSQELSAASVALNFNRLLNIINNPYGLLGYSAPLASSVVWYDRALSALEINDLANSNTSSCALQPYVWPPQLIGSGNVAFGANVTASSSETTCP